ncbi:hypothetical protein D3C72_1739300 [compost metagenome]
MGQDVRGQKAQVVRRRGGRCGKHHRGFGGAGDLNVLQCAEEAVDGQALVLLGTVQEAELEIVGRQLGAIVEGHIVAQHDAQAHVLVVQPAPAFDQRRLQLQIPVYEQRGIEDRFVQRLPRRERDSGGIP